MNNYNMIWTNIIQNGCDLMPCDDKPLVMQVMCLSMYWLHTTVILQDRRRWKMIPNIIFILFVNLRLDSPANILFASKERLDYIDKKIVYQTQADLGSETIL